MVKYKYNIGRFIADFSAIQLRKRRFIAIQWIKKYWEVEVIKLSELSISALENLMLCIYQPLFTECSRKSCYTLYIFHFDQWRYDLPISNWAIISLPAGDLLAWSILLCSACLRPESFNMNYFFAAFSPKNLPSSLETDKKLWLMPNWSKSHPFWSLKSARCHFVSFFNKFQLKIGLYFL